MTKSMLRPAAWGAETTADRFASSYGIRTGALVCTAGMVSRDISTGEVVGEGDVERQTEQARQNMAQVVSEAGCILADVVQLTTYVTNREVIAGVDATRQQHFQVPFPTNTVAIVAGTGDPAFLVELQVVAVAPDDHASGGSAAESASP